MTKFANNNIIIRYSKEAKPQVIAACKAAEIKGAIQNGDLVAYDATRALIDTLLGIDGVTLYGAKKLRNGSVAAIEIKSAEEFGDVVAEFLASKAEEYAALEAKADAALDAVDALLGVAQEVEKEEEVAEEVEKILSHYEVEFSGKDFSKALREIKKVEGRKFDPELKIWTIPAGTAQSKIDWLERCSCTIRAVYAPKK